MKNYLILLLTFLSLFANTSCSETEPMVDPVNDIVLTNKINDFMWKGMHSWYNWKTDVPNLSDSKDDNQNDYYTYLNGFSDPEDLFYSLCYNHKNNVDQANVVDRFSWFIEDYVVQNQQFQGISTSFGLRTQAVQINSEGDVILYVRFVAPNSPASDTNIKRGDIINALDNIVLTATNYSSTIGKLYSESVTLSFVSEANGVLTAIEDKTITAITLSQDPVHFKKVFANIGGKKVGYLVYNSFSSSYNDELNAAFAFFEAEGIEELVLDLRLNGGGSVETSAYLASMIYKAAGTEVFAELNFNSFHSGSNGTYDFENTLSVYDTNGTETGAESISRLNTLNQLYVLTSGSTASASEMIINGLKPYITVKVIGTTTYGKNVGSITLYDSPGSDYTNKTSASSTHKNAMQPIVFQIYNKNGESDYISGFTPDIEVVEYEYWNNILAFGDENEIVLKAALEDITGATAKSIDKFKSNYMEAFDADQFEGKFAKEMYINDSFFSKE